MTLPSIHDMILELMEEPYTDIRVCVDAGTVSALWKRDSDSDQVTARIEYEYAAGATRSELAIEIVRQLKEGS